MNEREELLGCPFCGSCRVGMASSIEATEWGVICSDCGASCSTSCETHDDAVAAWNRRIPAPAQRPTDPLYDSRNPNHGRIGGLIGPAAAQGSEALPAEWMRLAILKYLSVFDACGGSESVDAEAFAAARHGLREAAAEAPARIPMSKAPKDAGGDHAFDISLKTRAYWDDELKRWVLVYPLKMDYVPPHASYLGPARTTSSVPSTECDCGFSAEVCKTNPCMRKKMATSGLNPDAKYPNVGSPSSVDAHLGESWRCLRCGTVDAFGPVSAEKK
jgi:hypothetical protein